VQAILAQGVGHTVPEHETDTLDWFGLSSLVPGASSPGSSTTAPASTSVPPATIAPATTSVPPVSTPPASGATAAHWGQCGGIGWTGPTGMMQKSFVS